MFSEYLADQIINTYVIGSQVRLYTTAPTKRKAGVEVSGGTYAPQSALLVQDGGRLNRALNSGLITFGEMPGVTVTGMAITTMSGIVLFPLRITARTYAGGEPAQIEAGELIVDLS